MIRNPDPLLVIQKTQLCKIVQAIIEYICLKDVLSEGESTAFGKRIFAGIADSISGI